MRFTAFTASYVLGVGLGRPCRLHDRASAISQPLRGLRFGTGLAPTILLKDLPPAGLSAAQGSQSRHCLAAPPPLQAFFVDLSAPPGPSGLVWSLLSRRQGLGESAPPEGLPLRVKEIYKLKTRARALRFLEAAPLLGSRGGRAGKGTKLGAGKGTCQFTGECR